MVRRGRKPIGKTLFPERLRCVRKAKGLTQVDLAKKIGVAQAQVSSYERGTLMPPIDRLVHIAAILEVTTDELLGVVPPRENHREKDVRTWKRLERVLDLAPKERRWILRLIDMYAHTGAYASP